MNKVKPGDFSHSFYAKLNLHEFLLGISFKPLEVLCDDNQFRTLNTFEIGLFFFTFGYANLDWK